MTKFRYFSPVDGKAAPRYGTGTFVGARRSKEGFVWDVDAVVPVPVSEIGRYRREYARLLRDGCLVEKTREDYERHAAERGFEPVPDEGDRNPIVTSKLQSEPSTKKSKKKTIGADASSGGEK